MRKGIAGDRKGTVLVGFTLLFTVLMGFVALGIEVGTWYVMQAELSKAVDAAALAGAANIASPSINLTALTQDFGDANFSPGYMGTAAAAAASYAVTYNTSQVTVTGSVSGIGTIAQIFGVTAIPVSATGVARKNHVQIMMVLDCSGSMAGTPISNLKTASTGFLSFFTPDQSEDMMGVVTFSTAASVKVPLETNFASSMQSVINAVSANGATNPEDAIAQAGAQLPDQTGLPASSRKQQYIVFFTDGQSTAFRGTFVNQGNSYDAVVYTTIDPYDSSNEWYDVGTYLASATTGNYLSVNMIPTGDGVKNSSCKIDQSHGSPLYSTNWGAVFSVYTPPSPYSTSYCDSSQLSPRTKLASYVHTTARQMGINNANTVKGRGVVIYCIGLGTDIDKDFLNQVSSGPNFVYLAPNSSQLQAVFNLIAKDIILRLVQ